MHFKVGVFTREFSSNAVDNLLAKYDEQLEVETYVQETKAEFIESSRARCAEFLTSSEYEQYKAGTLTDTYYLRHFNGMEEALKGNDEVFYQYAIAAYNLDKESINENGDILGTCNPDGRYDWYVIGGRFSNAIVAKEGTRSDGAMCRELNLKLRRDIIKARSEYWDQVVLEKVIPGATKESLLWGPSKQQLLEGYKSREAYLESSFSAIPMNIVMPDGEWHDGPDGWGHGPDTYADFNKKRILMNMVNTFIKENPESYYIIVDCHC